MLGLEVVLTKFSQMSLRTQLTRESYQEHRQASAPAAAAPQTCGRRAAESHPALPKVAEARGAERKSGFPSANDLAVGSSVYAFVNKSDRFLRAF